MSDHKETGCVASSEELRKLIMENPDLPIMVEAETDLILDDSYTSWIAPSVHFCIGEVLDYDQHINDERIYTDRVEFEDDVYDWLNNTYYADNVLADGEPEPSDDVVEQKVKEILAEYEPYWKKVIIIYAGT